jgi:hypothetical protein
MTHTLTIDQCMTYESPFDLENIYRVLESIIRAPSNEFGSQRVFSITINGSYELYLTYAEIKQYLKPELESVCTRSLFK